MASVARWPMATIRNKRREEPVQPVGAKSEPAIRSIDGTPIPPRLFPERMKYIVNPRHVQEFAIWSRKTLQLQGTSSALLHWCICCAGFVDGEPAPPATAEAPTKSPLRPR